jgi:hypothetical protein
LSVDMQRFRRPLPALVALVAFTATLSLPFVTPRHAWVNDPDSGWTGLPFLPGPTPLVGAPAATSDGEHCAVCHWMRALGSSMAGVKMRRPDVARSRPRPFDTCDRVATVSTDTGPARAPPSILAPAVS